MKTLLEQPQFQPLWSFLPYLPDCLARWTGLTLGDIAQTFTDPAPPASAAVIACMADLIRPVLGPAMALALTRRLQRNPCVLSANHLGIDCIPEMVQAVHFFGLHELLHPEEETIIPVLACSGIPLQSFTYPRGLMPARTTEDGSRLRLPLFSSSRQDMLVLSAPALSKADVHSMRLRWRTESMLPRELNAAQALIEEHVLTPEVLALPRFSEQATRINATLSARRFPDNPRSMAVYLDLEEAGSRMLMHDVCDPNSVMYRMLFVPDLRARVLHALAGMRGCWSHEAMNGHPLTRTGRDGTVFFWHVDAQGRRQPLRLLPGERGSEPVLERNGFRLPLTPEAVLTALQKHRIYPGLLASYITLELSHGLRCYGGIFLVNYLPVMINAVRDAFMAEGAPVPDFAPYMALAAVALTVQTHTPSGLSPAGALELAAAGGLRQEHLHAIARLPVEQVLLPLSLPEWIQTYVPHELRLACPQPELAASRRAWQGIILA